MNRVKKFISLHNADKRLTLASLCTVGAVRIGLWMLPYRIVRVLLETLEKRPVFKACDSTPSVDRIIWAVKAASAVLPAATCLVQALSAKLLLTRRGYRPVLRIGVAKDKNGQLDAHAWLENEGQVVLGELRDRSRYTSLPPIANLHS
jgi:hypothetical protein